MKIHRSLQTIGFALAASFLMGGASHGSTLYFDQNGATPGFGIAAETTYGWGDGNPSVWNTSSTGGSGTFTAWDNEAGDIASFGAANPAGGWTVRLTSDIKVNGLDLTSGATGPNSQLMVNALATRVLTLQPGAEVALNQGGSRTLVIGSNVNVSGNIVLKSAASAAQAGGFAIEGAGSLYSGTISTVGNVVITTTGSTRFGKDTKIVLNTGGKLTSNVNNITMTIGELSGNGGVLDRSGSNYTVLLDQDTTTTWAGQLATSIGLGSYKFQKSGTGALVLNGANHHYIAQSVSVQGGSLYVNANLMDASNAANGVLVGGSGNFGGRTVSSKHVTLQAATSQLTAGMLNVTNGELEVATLTLDNGLTATNGGVFNFVFNASDGAGGTLNSLIRVTGGALSLGGTKVANIFDFGTGEIEAGVAYTLFTGAGITADGWVLGARPLGWELESFSVDGNALKVTFEAIPEPSTLLISVAVGAILLVGRRNRLRR